MQKNIFFIYKIKKIPEVPTSDWECKLQCLGASISEGCNKSVKISSGRCRKGIVCKRRMSHMCVCVCVCVCPWQFRDGHFR